MGKQILLTQVTLAPKFFLKQHLVKLHSTQELFKVYTATTMNAFSLSQCEHCQDSKSAMALVVFYFNKLYIPDNYSTQLVP